MSMKRNLASWRSGELEPGWQVKRYDRKLAEVGTEIAAFGVKFGVAQPSMTRSGFAGTTGRRRCNLSFRRVW
jgi:hypothetical protein